MTQLAIILTTTIATMLITVNVWFICDCIADSLKAKKLRLVDAICIALFSWSIGGALSCLT
jgi:putative Ca2+/H+ antiporter (TMEM165/GDT1 family)